MMAAAVPASADAVTGTVDDGTQGLKVNVGDGFKSNLSTALIGLTLDDGTKLGVYCVQIDQGIDRAHPLVEKDWDAYPDAASRSTTTGTRSTSSCTTASRRRTRRSCRRS